MKNVVELTGRVEFTAHPVVVNRDAVNVMYLVDAVYDEAVLTIQNVYVAGRCDDGYAEEPPALPLSHIHPAVLATIETVMRAQVIVAWVNRATCIRCRQETSAPERHEIYCGQTEAPEWPS